MPASSKQKPFRLHLLLAVLLGSLHAWLAGSVSSSHSCTYDESAHVTAGRAYWLKGDFRLQPENGLLPQLWFGLPLALSTDLHPPATDQAAWIHANVWKLGDDFLHGHGNSADTVLRRARMMNALVGGALVGLIVLWVTSIQGLPAGVGAGMLAAFSPTLLAHAGFATSDTMGALGLVAATLAFWRLLHLVSATRVLAAGATAALLALSKYSVALFPLIAASLLAARLIHPAPLPSPAGRLRRWARLRRLVLGIVGAVVVAWALVWAAYGFRFEARGKTTPTNATFTIPWDNILLPRALPLDFPMADGKTPPGHSTTLTAGPVQHFVRWSLRHRILPEAWLYGFAFVERHSRFRLAYFSGEWSAVGWRTFFPVAYLIKSTPAELALHLLGAAAACGALLRTRCRRSCRRIGYRAVPVISALGVYGIFALTSHLNIGHRHLLPLYAFGALLMAFLPLPRRAPIRWPAALVVGAVLGLLGSHLVSSTSIRPSYLAYFNSLIGGPDQGYRYLSDSSLDWGQDLPALRDWITANPSTAPLYLSYFGNGSPPAYGIRATRIADDYFDSDPDRSVAASLEPGRYVISATMWTRVYTQVRGDWSVSYEARYQHLRAWLTDLARRQTHLPALDPEGNPMPVERIHFYLKQYDHLRFGRLIHQIAPLPPVARVAHNWFVYDLTAPQIKAALDGPLHPLAPDAASVSVIARPAAN